MTRSEVSLMQTLGCRQAKWPDRYSHKSLKIILIFHVNIVKERIMKTNSHNFLPHLFLASTLLCILFTTELT